VPLPRRTTATWTDNAGGSYAGVTGAPIRPTPSITGANGLTESASYSNRLSNLREKESAIAVLVAHLQQYSEKVDIEHARLSV
jgi:hypothetical protein